ncbi:MAG: SsrA-binding protein SmpB [Oceanospirillaceae bacterium]|nr:SsrA-binding protein SmpB [Oceanospirillaceae bacterium]
MSKSKKPQSGSSICSNRKASHDFFIEDRYEAGVSLMGWEVKSLREGKGNLSDAYVDFQKGEAWLLNCQITPLNSASTHVIAEPKRLRKLLLNRRELDKLAGQVEAKGYTCVALELYWKGHMVKCKIALARGKQNFDKRNSEKERDWNKEKERLMKHKV